MSYIKSPSPRAFSSGVWTRNQLIIWGGSGETSVLSDGSSYDPHADSWSPISPAPIGSRTSHVSVLTGKEMIVWGKEVITFDIKMIDMNNLPQKTTISITFCRGENC